MVSSELTMISPTGKLMKTGQAHHILDTPGKTGIVISAEHSGVEIPPELGDLGISQKELHRHIGYDIGIEGVVHHLHRLSGHPAILGRYSRLVADVNRPEDSPECVIERSDGTQIPANTGLNGHSRQKRINRYHRPYHTAFAELVRRAKPGCILSVHSFTRKLRTEGIRRPWHCGILYGVPEAAAKCCIGHLRKLEGIVVGDNQPYQFDADRLIPPKRVDGRPIPTLVVEIRQDLIENGEGQEKWAAILGGLLEACMADCSCHRTNAGSGE